MKKNKILICAGMIFTFALTACGGNNTSQIEDNNSIWWKTTGELTKDENNEIVFNNVSISLTHVVCGHDQLGFENLIKQFNSEFDGKIHVSTDIYDQLTIDSNVSRRIQNNDNPPDLVFDHQKSHKNFEINKLIQPVDECFSYAGIELKKEDFVKKFADYSNLGYGDGSKIFNYPVDAQSIVGYYRKDLLEKLGESVPKTRSEMIRIAKKAQSELNMANPIGITGNSEFLQYYVYTTALAQNGLEFYNKENYYSEWTNEKNKQAFRDGVHAIYDLTTENLYRSGLSESEALNSFCNRNENLFFFGLPFEANVIFDSFRTSHNTTVDNVKSDYIGGFSSAKMFALDETKNYAGTIFGDSHAFMVSKSVEDITKKAAIATFINWFNSKSNVGATWAELGHASGVKRVIESSEYQNSDFVKNYTKEWYPNMDDFETPGVTPYYSITFGRGVYSCYEKCFKNAKGVNSKIDENVAAVERTVNATIRGL